MLYHTNLNAQCNEITGLTYASKLSNEPKFFNYNNTSSTVSISASSIYSEQATLSELVEQNGVYTTSPSCSSWSYGLREFFSSNHVISTSPGGVETHYGDFYKFDKAKGWVSNVRLDGIMFVTDQDNNDTIYNAALSMCADWSVNPVRSFKVYVQNGYDVNIKPSSNNVWRNCFLHDW